MTAFFKSEELLYKEVGWSYWHLPGRQNWSEVRSCSLEAGLTGLSLGMRYSGIRHDLVPFSSGTLYLVPSGTLSPANPGFYQDAGLRTTSR